MAKASRAIIIENNKILVMHRNKYGNQYFTLVGGRLNEGETSEHALVREIKEETGLDIIKARLVYHEQNVPPYNEQYIYLCEVAEHGPVGLEETSEEFMLNKLELTTHDPIWVDIKNFPRIAFRTIQVQNAISKALVDGFPSETQEL